MEAFVVSLLMVGVSEFGDKTQIIVLLLASRFGRSASVLFGMVLAVLANNAIAVFGGTWLRAMVGDEPLAWAIGILFLSLAVLALLTRDDREEHTLRAGRNAFLVSFVSLFLADIGDKSQLLTMALAAKYDAVLPVLVGGTLGPALVNLPVIFLGKFGAQRLPQRPIRLASAALFGIFGAVVLIRGPLHL